MLGARYRHLGRQSLDKANAYLEGTLLPSAGLGSGDNSMDMLHRNHDRRVGVGCSLDLGWCQTTFLIAGDFDITFTVLDNVVSWWILQGGSGDKVEEDQGRVVLRLRTYTGSPKSWAWDLKREHHRGRIAVSANIFYSACANFYGRNIAKYLLPFAFFTGHTDATSSDTAQYKGCRRSS